jgi:hypothetical protein
MMYSKLQIERLTKLYDDAIASTLVNPDDSKDIPENPFVSVLLGYLDMLRCHPGFTCASLWLIVEFLMDRKRDNPTNNVKILNVILIHYRITRNIRHPSLKDKYLLLKACLKPQADDYPPFMQTVIDVIRVVSKATRTEDQSALFNFTDKDHEPLLVYLVSQKYSLTYINAFCLLLTNAGASFSTASKLELNDGHTTPGVQPIH